MIVGLVLFVGIHLVPSLPGVRAGLVGRLGAGPYKLLFTAVALAGVVTIAYGYGAARLTDTVILWDPPVFTRHLALLLMLPVFPMIVAAYMPTHIKAVLKHPMLAAVKLWAVTHLLANGRLADVVLFGTLLAWAVVVRISLKRRGKVGGEAAPVWRADITAKLIGFAVYLLMVFGGHAWLIGVPVI
jgi:uncharacterized membrane protein